ncbi:MAG: lipopolysaccharide biosynthesis protein [Sphingomicrobium sp.]
MASQETPSETEQSLTRHTLGGIFWLTVGRFFKAPINLLTVAILARLLTPSDFGILAIGTLAVSFTNVIVDGSFGMVLIQRREVDPPLIGASLLLSVSLAGLFSAAIIIGAPLIERVFDFPHLEEVIIVLGAIVPVTAVTTVTTALLQRAFQFRTLTRNSITSQVIYASVAIGSAFAEMGLWSLVAAQVCSFASDALLGFLAVRTRYRVTISREALRDVLTSGGMFTVSKLLNWAGNSVDRIVIGRFVGAAELGLYSRAATLMLTAREVSGAGPIRVLFSSFAKMQHDLDRLGRAYIRSLSLSLIASALVSGFVIINAELIVRVLLGPKWLPTILMVQILFAAFVAKAASVVADAIPLALGRSGLAAMRQATQLVLVSAFAGFGVQFGVVGGVIGVAIAYWLFYLFCLMLAHKLLSVRWLEVGRLHLNSIAIAIPPSAIALASRSLTASHAVWAQCIPALVFGAAAVVVLALAPLGLVGEDVVRARGHAMARLFPRLVRATP